MNIAVLASGLGSTLQAVMDRIESGDLNARVVLVLGNNSRAQALERARSAGVPVVHISGATHPDDDERDRAIAEALVAADTDLVLLAGYMKQLGPTVLARFEGRILNTHPSLLPKYGGHGFYGRRVHEAVIEAGDTETGATVHVVTRDYDAGPVVGQIRVPVRASDTVDTLEANVKKAEQRLLVEVLRDWAAQMEDQGPRMAKVMPGD